MSITPPRPRGPHLNALRSFEAAARLGGFAAAAEELCVTPGAVSQQVKALEDWIGASLFERRTQGVALTVLGQGTLADFSTAFDALGGALHGLRAQAPRTAVHIAALPSIAQLWLTPRLAAVRAALPGQSISVTAMEAPPNLRREIFDISVFYSDSPQRHALEPDVIFPVCTPQIAARLNTPADLADEVLIHDATWHHDWQKWHSAAGSVIDAQQQAAVYSLYAIAVDEALGGAGVLMGHRALVSGHLKSGRLVKPFDLECPTGAHLVVQVAHPHGPTSTAAKVAVLLRNAR